MRTSEFHPHLIIILFFETESYKIIVIFSYFFQFRNITIESCMENIHQRIFHYRLMKCSQISKSRIPRPLLKKSKHKVQVHLYQLPNQVIFKTFWRKLLSFLILGTSGAWAAKSLSPIGQDWPAASPELPKSKSGASFWGEMKKSSKAPESKSLEILDDEEDIGEGKISLTLKKK